MENDNKNMGLEQYPELASIINTAVTNAIQNTKLDAKIIEKVANKHAEIYQFFEDLFNEEALFWSHNYTDELIMIEALDGQTTISDARKTFKSHIDKGFKTGGFNNPEQATPEIFLEIRRIKKSRTFTQIFTLITHNLDKLIMTQSQIIRFCEKYRKQLNRGGYTVFLIKKNKNYFVVKVCVHSTSGLKVHLYGLEETETRFVNSCHDDIVTPKLIV